MWSLTKAAQRTHARAVGVRALSKKSGKFTPAHTSAGSAPGAGQTPAAAPLSVKSAEPVPASTSSVTATTSSGAPGKPLAGSAGSGKPTAPAGGKSSGGSGLAVALLLAGAAAGAYQFREQLGIAPQVDHAVEQLQAKYEGFKASPSPSKSAATPAPAPAAKPAVAKQPAAAVKPAAVAVKPDGAAQAAAREKEARARVAEQRELQAALKLAHQVQAAEERAEKRWAAQAKAEAAAAATAAAQASKAAPAAQAAAKGAASGGEGAAAGEAAAPQKTFTFEEITEHAKAMAASSPKPGQAPGTAMLADLVSQVLRSELDAAQQAELASMSEQALRQRCAQLLPQLAERSKMEAMQMLQLARLYEEQGAKREAALTKEHAAALDARVEEARRHLQAAMDQDKAQWQASTVVELQAAANEAADRALQQSVLELKQAEAAATAARLSALKSLEAKIAATQRSLEERNAYERASRRAHRMMLALTQLNARLRAGLPVTEELEAARVASQHDPLVVAAIDSLPEAVHGRGVPGRPALMSMLPNVLNVARASALTPAQGGTLGHMLGVAANKLLTSTARMKDSGAVSPTQAVHVPVAGKQDPITLSDALGSSSAQALQAQLSAAASDVRDKLSAQIKDIVPPDVAATARDAEAAVTKTVEQVRTALPKADEHALAALDWIAAAETAAAADDLERVVASLERLDGYPASLIAPWLKQARRTQHVEQAVAVLDAQVKCATAAMY